MTNSVLDSDSLGSVASNIALNKQAPVQSDSKGESQPEAKGSFASFVGSKPEVSQ
jgi:hypothetical protein